ncbi:MAG: BamA/TamA family outer membrane protein [Candidatus Lernaella stagnicola]|nr:BamA/TamA family outer membrane protein [Candidatus Lernaella stagnicola]
MWRKVFMFALLILISASPVLAQDVPETTEDDDPSKVTFIPIPVVFYTPETNFGFGASGVLLYRLPGEPAASRTSQFSGVAFYTLKKQYSVILSPKMYFANEDYYLDLVLGMSHYPSQFYGMGNNTRLADEETFTADSFRGDLDFLRRVYKDFYAGVAYRFEHFDITDVEDDGLIANQDLTGDDAGTVSQLGAVLLWDSRDSALSSRSGSLYQLTALLADPGVGSDFVYNDYLIEIRHFIPLFERHAFGVQLLSQIMTGDPPFDEMATIGGSDRLRGVEQGRFRDKAALVAQMEYRFPIYWRFSGAAFLGGGAVEERFNFINLNEAHVSAGGGLRFRLTKDEPLHLRLDLGFSEDDTGVYFVFGEAF